MTREPHHLDVALRLTLKPAAGRHPVEITVEVELQERCGIIGGSPCGGGLEAGEAQGAQIEFVDERFDYPNRIVFGDIVIRRTGQQPGLPPVLPFDEPTHADLRR